MRDLVELVHRLPWSRLRSSPAWDTLLPPGTKMARLFSFVQANAELTEAEAAGHLYGSTDAIGRLRSLKSKTKERLLSAIFLLEPDEAAFSDRQQAHYECQRRWATALVLLNKKVSSVAIEQLERMLRHAEHFEFTELAMSAAFHLRHHYGMIQGDAEKYRYYRQLYRQYQALWALENEAEELYTELLSTMANTRAPQQDMARTAEAYFRRVEPHLKAHASFRLHLNGRLLQMLAYSSRHDYRAVADLCEDALAFFQSKPYRSPLPLQIFYYQLVVCCVQMRDFGRGQAILRQHGHLYPPGTLNWYKVQELYFLLATHTQHYDDAFDTCMRVLREADFAKQPPYICETWKIYEAYAQLLARTRRADRTPDPNFRIGKFLNEIPTFSKDRRGMNIPALIARLLFDIQQKRYDAAIERVEALSKYADRYVRKNELFRSNCFLKMLLQIPQAAFHREAAARKAQRYHDMLGQMPVELANQPHEIEVIPYEDLWEMTLEMLPQQRVRP
ncbi:MAG: hypothetical protein RMJ33_01760 [Saprospiraceae bacterium]|nr:hypothetical protein [Saprospiraceae bacterium]MDW8228538.1 hypothetical protein [Saprospiraceae bacterium]